MQTVNVRDQEISLNPRNTPRKSRSSPFSRPASPAAAREWTAVEKFRLKGLAKKAYPADKIARSLGRPVDVTVAMACKLGLQLGDNLPTPTNSLTGG